MTGEHWTDRLSDYLDGELSVAERAAAERHLAGCAECASVLEGLRAVVEAAAAAAAVAPVRDLWPGIRSGLKPRIPAGVVPLERARRRVVLTIPQSLAAGIALVALSAGAMWLTVGSGNASSTALAQDDPALVFAAAYEPAMSELETEYDRRREELDPETIRVVERNLAIIDAAIAEARQALATDPASEFLSAHLAESMRRRMSLLRQAASL